MKNIKTFRIADAILCIILIMLAVFIPIFALGNGKFDTFTVECNGIKTEYSLDKPAKYDFESNGITLAVVCDGGSVFVESSSCPDKHCVHSGRISRSGQIIVCAPGRFSVSIGSGGDFDAVTG